MTKTTAVDLHKFVGSEGSVVVEPRRDSPGLRIEVRVTNARQVYGKTQFEITPISGQGFVWVDDFRFQVKS